MQAWFETLLLNERFATELLLKWIEVFVISKPAICTSLFIFRMIERNQVRDQNLYTSSAIETELASL